MSRLCRYLSNAALFCFIAFALTMCMSSSKSENLIIRTTWDNLTVPEDEHVHIELTLQKEHLIIGVEAKFYNDPELPDQISNPETHTTLYNFEVVELFLLGQEENYLEIELGPRGQYFVLELHGERNATRYPIKIDQYNVTNSGNGRWSAKAYISRKELPERIEKLNAYAIHGTGENRVYMSLYPAPFNSTEFPKPDFHKLELFQKTNFFENMNF